MAIPAPQADTLAESIERFLRSEAAWAERLRPTPRRVNVRPYVEGARFDGQSLILEMWVSPDGSARADEVARCLGLGALLDEGGYLERADLILADEMDPAEVARVPELSLKALTAEAPDLAPREPEREPAAAHWGASPNGPVVE